MEKMVSVAEAKLNIEDILQGVSVSSDEVVIEEKGEPVAVVLPISVYRQLQKRRSREAAGELMRLSAERANLSPEEADRLAAEAVRWTRANKAE